MSCTCPIGRDARPQRERLLQIDVLADDELKITGSWRRGWKRLFDLGAGILLAILATPAILVLSLWSAVRLRAWPFFVQKRVGREGAIIGIVKIRTLPRHTPSYLSKSELNSTGEVPGACHWLRSTHLDELPQLWQVGSGTLSLVGPRPMIESIEDTFKPDFRQLRESVRPGVTGLWQISTEGSQQIDPEGRLDAYYVRHVNFRLDLWILLVTLWQLLGGPKYDAPGLLKNLRSDDGPVRHFDLPHESGVGATPSTVWNFLSAIGFVVACFGALLTLLSL